MNYNNMLSKCELFNIQFSLFSLYVCLSNISNNVSTEKNSLISFKLTVCFFGLLQREGQRVMEGVCKCD